MKFSVLCCDIFKDDIVLMSEKLENKPLQIESFKAESHLNPDNMRNVVCGKLSGFSKENNRILLIFGLCGNAALGLRSDDFELVIPRVHDCRGIFFGSSAAAMDFARNNPRAFFASPGYISAGLLPSEELFKNIKSRYLSEYGKDGADILMEAFLGQFAAYDEVFYMQFHESQESKRACMECAKFMNWKFREICANNSLLSDALQMRIDSDRFFILPKGKTLKASYDEKIFDI